MTREEITNSQDYKAEGVALDWYKSLNAESVGEIHITDAYADGVIYGWNNPQWIPVDEKLPEEGGEYLVSDGTDSTVDIWLYGIGWRDPDNNGRVTHWMPLPKAPRKESER